MNLPTQNELRGNAAPLLKVLAENIVYFRDQHLHEGTDYFRALTEGQRPLAVVSQCVDSRQPIETITGLPPGQIIPQKNIAGISRDYPDSEAGWATIQFAVKKLGVPIVIKLGHTGCGGAEQLVDLALNSKVDDQPASDPTIKWLQHSVPFAQKVIAKVVSLNPSASKAEMARELEREIVRDGVKRKERFFDQVIRQGDLDELQRPVIVGLLFEMHTAKLYVLQESGEFRLLSESVADAEPQRGDPSAAGAPKAAGL